MNMQGFVFVFLVVAAFSLSSPCHGFCGDRKLNGDLARAAAQGNEFIRSKLADKKAMTFDYIRAAAFSTLRLGGFTIDMLSSLGMADLGRDIKKLGLNNITTGRIAYYVQGVQAICKDPKSFNGYDLIKRLTDGIKEYSVAGFNHPFAYSLVVLSLCDSGHASQSYHNYTLMIRSMIQKHLRNHPTHGGNTLSLATMALTCMYNKQPQPKPCYWWCDDRRKSLRNVLKRTIRYAASALKRSQKSDGRFGNSITTALVSQALLYASKARIYTFPKHRCVRAMKYILGTQAKDGSFSSPLVATTMQVTQVLIGALPSDITTIKCPKPQKPEDLKNITVCVKVEFLTTPTNGTAPPNPAPVTVTVLNRTNAYHITKEASKLHPCYKFTTVMTAYGNSITSICGVYKERANKKYWSIYSGPNTKPGTGVDNFYPKDGSCVIYKFKKLNFRK